MPLTTYARTLVSGNKARYIDEHTDINLDLVYGQLFRKRSEADSQSPTASSCELTIRLQLTPAWAIQRPA